MDRQTQAREMRKLAAAPDYTIGSVQAVTEHGQLEVASASGSQIGPYAAGAGQLILIISSQKLVPDMQTSLQRVTARATLRRPAAARANGQTDALCRILSLERDYRPGRTTVILVRKPLGLLTWP